MNRRTDEEGARRRLFNLYGLLKPEGPDAKDSALIEVLRIIGRHEGIDFKWPTKVDRSHSKDILRDVLDMSGVRGRQVKLGRKEPWWVGDSGVMLAFRADDDQPVALLPGGLGRYWEVDSTGCKARITAERAQSLREDAWLFYPPLPSASVGFWDLLRLAGRGLTRDILWFMASGLLVGLVMLLPAMVLGFVVDKFILTGESSLLYVAIAFLAVFALIGALLQIFQGMVLMRLEGRATSRVEAAFWDRLLRLPPSFLRRYSAGDLALRGMTFQNFREAMQVVVAHALLPIVFLSPAFVLIFLYDAVLGTVAAAFGFLSLILAVAMGLRQLSAHGRLIRTVQSLAGQLFQFISGISKLRGAGAEGSAFAVWARGYREQKQAELELGTYEAHLRALGAALPLLAGAVLFVVATLQETISVGDFLVIYFVFMVFLAAVIRLGASFSRIAALMPALNQIKPFLAEPPETTMDGEPVGTLGGDIVFDHVSFRYDPEGPLVLDDVSIRARPGEFVAIAGESGSGKSTFFRLALGLEQPSMGSVYYDGARPQAFEY